MEKIKVGIDINEILRAKWAKFDRCFIQEFGDDELEDDAKYVYDLFENYPFKDTEEELKLLNEDVPEDINPLDYQVDPKTGEAPADFITFKTEIVKRTARENYNKFLYEDYLFEIFGAAPPLYRNQEVDVENFRYKYNDCVEFVLLSKENSLSIQPTLFFLSKYKSRFTNYKFVETSSEMINAVDILITTDPEILDIGTPEGKKIIKLSRPYNVDSQNGEIKEEILQLNDLIGNPEFEKLINYPKDKICK